MNNPESSGTITYEDLEPTLRTGDLLLCHGSSGVSRDIEDITRSDWSHVAMVIRPDPTQPPLVWQTGPNPIVEDVHTDTQHGGAQLGDLRAALGIMGDPRYGDTVFVRRMTVDRTPEFESDVQQAIVGLDGRPFPQLWKMALEWVAGRFDIPTSDRTFYCAELVARTFMVMKLLPVYPPVDAYGPRSFSTENSRLGLLRDATLGAQYQVLTPQSTPVAS
jgi:hypothetical protein